MFKKQDPYSFAKVGSIKLGSDPIGTFFAEYQVTLYDDVQMLGADSVNKPKRRQYYVKFTQRISIYNKSGFTIGPESGDDYYGNYPVLLNSLVAIKSATEPTPSVTEPSQNATFFLLDYSPKTVNTKVQSSESTGNSSGKTEGQTTSSTVGSSTAQTNSYTVSASLSEESFGISASAETSTTVTNEQSNTVGSDLSVANTRDRSSSAEMSIKDWGAYALVIPDTQGVAWTFGQEYPWDAVTYRRRAAGSPNGKNTKQVPLAIPNGILLRLFEITGSSDKPVLNPPSQLSMLGINFASKGMWLATVPDGLPDEITVTHDIAYVSASHALASTGKPDAPNTVTVYEDQQPAPLQSTDSGLLSTTLDLALMALNPLGAPNRTAIVGFLPGKFTVPPAAGGTAAPAPFKIVSSSNNMLIKDTTSPVPVAGDAGFSASETSLSAAFSSNCTSLQFTAYFKVIDVVTDYNLFLKHWKKYDGGIRLTIVVNKDVNTKMVKFVDAMEAEGGESNLLAISLRYQNFSSIEYHDYLQLGLNAIEITIEPIDQTKLSDSVYQIRAISIEKA